MSYNSNGGPWVWLACLLILVAIAWGLWSTWVEAGPDREGGAGEARLPSLSCESLRRPYTNEYGDISYEAEGELRYEQCLD